MIDTVYNEYKDICDMFSMKVDSVVEESKATLQRRLMLSHIEGLLVACFTTATDDRRALKRKVMSIKNRLSEGEYQQHVCPALRRRMVEVARMRS